MSPPHPPSTRNLDDWLAYQQQLHAQAIDLGLKRVRAVWQRLGSRRPAPQVITVGGTNGKGSTVAMLEAMLTANGRTVGCYTSPHLHRYNERVRLRGREAGDAALVAAFERIEAARGGTPLTWFEFGTLAALELMADAGLDVAVLEVGLGGRLDAVNVIDADAAIVVTVDLDHTDYLGPDRDAIGIEKAGIFRPGRPAIIGDSRAPHGLVDTAEAGGAKVWLAGRDYRLLREVDGTVWHAGRQSLRLPPLAVPGPFQADNAAAALTALYALRTTLGWPAATYAAALAHVEVPARIQVVAEAPTLIVDVGHNPQAARALADWLRANRGSGHTLAVFSALADKDIAGIGAALGSCIDHWFCCGIDDAGPRGLEAGEVERRLLAGWPAAESSRHADVPGALAAARAVAAPGDRIVAFGSFHVAAAVPRGSGKA
ncbi:MAG TPA: bifunctional tetrahydrofolate synthase/dihydrofolate synthase [Rhodanobacteraceae bacterium]|nr:bifunctional tetrahydrofolate synthase/dihydrofolate synthase [Rhodanobacteraceae bacterium]